MMFAPLVAFFFGLLAPARADDVLEDRHTTPEKPRPAKEQQRSLRLARRALCAVLLAGVVHSSLPRPVSARLETLNSAKEIPLFSPLAEAR